MGPVKGGEPHGEEAVGYSRLNQVKRGSEEIETTERLSIDQRKRVVTEQCRCVVKTT